MGTQDSQSLQRLGAVGDDTSDVFGHRQVVGNCDAKYLETCDSVQTIQDNRAGFILHSASVICYYYFAALASI